MASPDSKHILVVEDDDMSFKYTEYVLNLSQYRISRVKTGIDAIEACRSIPRPDLVLMDIQLPDMNGEKAAAGIRHFDQAIPIIANTASQISDEKDKIMQSGFNELIMKPFSVEELLELISRYV